MKPKVFVEYLLSLPKTIVFNLRTFPLKTAIRLPMILRYDVIVESTHKGAVRIPDDARGVRIFFGFGGTSVVQPYQHSMIALGSRMGGCNILQIRGFCPWMLFG